MKTGYPDPFGQDTATLGTPWRNARATARYFADRVAAGGAPLVELSPYGDGLTIQGDVALWELQEIELGQRAAYILDGITCDAIKECASCRLGGSHV